MIGLVITILAIYYFWEPAKRYLSIFFVFFLITGGFQIIPSNLMELPILGISKSHDWALLYLMSLVVIMPRAFLDSKPWSKINEVTIFGLLLIILALYSILYVGVEQQVTIRVLRNYLFFLLIFPFLQLSKADFPKTLRLIVYCTTLASFLYCLQPVFGQTILNGAPVEGFGESSGLMRFYNLPFLLLPTVFLLFNRKSDLNIKFYKVVLGINLMAIILSQHRNLLMIMICCFFIYLIISNKLKFKHLLVYGVITSGLFFGVDTYFDNRFSKGILELSESTHDVTPYYLYSTNISEVSTTEFRRLHFLERFQYAQEKVVTSLLGLGFLTEDSWVVDRLSFNIGLTSEYGEVAQVDTSDIAWSVFVIHFGIIGTLVLLYLYLGLAVKFYFLKSEEFCKIGFLFIIALLAISFYGVEIIMPHSMTFLMLVVAYWYVIKIKIGIKNYETEANSSFSKQSNGHFKITH